MTDTADSDWRDRFITHLERLRDEENRGALADLRKGLGEEPGTVSSMYRHVIPWIPATRFVENTAYTVASLFALHPDKGGNRSLGGALSLIKTPDGRELLPSIERRFTALLNIDEEDLPVHLRQAVSLCKSNEIALNWRRFIRDVQAWGHPERYVQRNWARDYWGTTQL